MKQNALNIASLFCLATWIGCSLYLLIYNILNPDYTSMRIFFNRWYVAIVGVISFLSFINLGRYKGNKDVY